VGSHARRLPLGTLVRGPVRPALTAVCLLLSLAACSDGEDPVILPSDIVHSEGPAKTVPEEVERAEPAKKPKTVVVKEARPFLEEDFIQKFIRKNPQSVNQAFNLFKKMLAFPDPDGDKPALDFGPAEVKTMQQEFVAAVQRAKSLGKRRFVEDMEIFAVFSRAFDAMSLVERDDLLALWRESIGTAEPPRPATGNYRLFWIRETIQLWSLGGNRWWWGWHALEKDPSFGYSREEGAWYTAPDGTLYVSRKP
jgi:hypothetical protein